MNKQNTKCTTGLFLCGLFALLPVLVFAEQTDELDIEKPRWFEVEIILYKASSTEALQNESWDTDTSIQLPEELIDFLQPFEPVETLESDQLKPEQQEELGKLQDPAISEDEALTENSELAKELEAEEQVNVEEKPFLLLEDELLQLKAEALNISRHANYELLAHFSWRQPVLGKRETTSLRIAGGFDYQQSFEYTGEKKLQLIPVNEPQTLDENGELLDSDDIDNLDSQLIPEQLLQTELVESNHLSAQNETQEALDSDLQEGEPGLIPLPWVPEIDGSVLVYIHRNYLHFDTDLYYRRPGREQIDIFEFQTPLPPLDSIGSEQQAENNLLDLVQQPINTDDFSWHYDDDFLSEDSEQTYTERLFNYPLKQNRRLRSNQLHYFDHPLIGMLVMIRPYEIEQEEQQAEDDLVTQSQGL